MNLTILFARNVRALRIQSGLTQAELAEQAGITTETVARIERMLQVKPSYQANPVLDTMERIATALGVDVVRLLASKAAPRSAELVRLRTLLRSAPPAVHRRVLKVAEALLQEAKGLP
jgi:transcriptional regulator with XRE-family HTH domain